MYCGCEIDFKLSSTESRTLIPISSGEEQCAPCHSWGAGVRTHFVIHYIISGKGVFYCGTNKFHLKAGQIFVVFPGTIVKYQADEHDPWHYVWVNFFGSDATEIVTSLGLTLKNPVMSVRKEKKLLNTMREMPLEMGIDIRTKLFFTSKLYEFLSYLSTNEAHDEKDLNIYIENAKEYIETHYHENITVEEVSDYVGISRKYLFSIFKKHLDISPKEYVMQYRIERAKDLLENPSIPIGTVAYSVGYQDALTFSKMFKLKTGISPSEYRQDKT